MTTAFCSGIVIAVAVGLPAAAEKAGQTTPPSWVVFPEAEWIRISPEEAGFDGDAFRRVTTQADVHGGTFGGVRVGEKDWGAVLTRGGYLVQTWGNPQFKQPSASLGKCIVRALFGISVEAGVIRPDEPISRTWTGRGQLSHPHKELDAGLHRTLTWRQLLEHQGGFVLESGFHWRNKTLFHAQIPDGVRWTGDPLFDNFAHTPPGAITRYSSGGYVRLGQALTAAWNRDLKDVLDERLFRHLGIPADRWDWVTAEQVHRDRNFYPDFPGYGEYVDPPYSINGHVVRGGAGWMVMSAEDLARFGLLIATGGVWKGQRLVGEQWLRGHAGLDIHVVAGDRESLVSIAKINTKGFPFGQGVGTQGKFVFPKDLVLGPVKPGSFNGKPQASAVMKMDRRLPKSADACGLPLNEDAKRSVVDHTKSAVPARPPYPVKVEKNVRIPMRDGVTLAADVYRPDAEGRFPALVQLSYYVTGPGQATFFAPRGYVCVLANSRGRGGSDGEWDPYVNEPRDGFDTQQWVGKQPWCDGNVGTFGQSYNGFTQTMSAPLASPHLKCTVPVEGQQSFFGHQYNDGVLQLNVVFTHGLFATGATGLQGHIPIRDPHFLQLPLMSAADKVPHPQAQRIKTWMQHARYDEHWKAFGVKEKYDRIQAPAYFASGWYDNLVHENFRNFRGFREQGGSEAARRGTKLRVGPGVHGANTPPLVQSLRWYDYWLRGLPTGIDQEAPLRIFVMGAGRWRDEYEWPLARTQFTKFHLHSGGRANSVRGDGRLTKTPPDASSPPDTFVYDPANPVYTLGGQISTNPEVWGPQDRQSVQTRDDVLVYTTEPLTEDTEVTGPIELKLFAASTAVDTDFTATLTDVHPDGRAIHICEGIRGVTFRESLEQPTPIVPGKVYEYAISLWATSQVFAAGHRIRLEVSSSNFPRYARNQNTGLPLGTSAEVKTATQTIFHDAERPSHLILPVIPAAPSGPIQPRADGTLRLTADAATTRGPSVRLGAEAGILGWWTHADDCASWNVAIRQAGCYRAVINFACADEAAGNEFELAIGPARLTGRVPSTGTWYDLREQEFGVIDLPAGTHAVVIRSAGPLRGALFDLRAVRLVPER